VATLRILAALS